MPALAQPTPPLAQPEFKGAITEQEILDYLTPLVAKWWLPDEVVFIDAVPTCPRTGRRGDLPPSGPLSPNPVPEFSLGCGQTSRKPSANQPGDLVITADIPLAAEVIARGAHALDPRGEIYSEDNVRERLAMRNLMQEPRGTGASLGGPAPFYQTDRHLLRQSTGLLPGPESTRVGWSGNLLARFGRPGLGGPSNCRRTLHLAHRHLMLGVKGTDFARICKMAR